MSDVLPSGSSQGSETKNQSATKTRQYLYFEDVFAAERKAIDIRREALRRKQQSTATPDQTMPERAANPADAPHAGHDFRYINKTQSPPEAAEIDYSKSRPLPEKSDYTGLALSGGGIRSASLCLGALQALHKHKLIDRLDYLSSVSGGGYIANCLHTAMTKGPGKDFPFGDNIADNTTLGYLRNFSNYLMPRGRSALQNYGELCLIVLRGWLANGILILTFMLLLGGLTAWVDGRYRAVAGGVSNVLRYNFIGEFLSHFYDFTAGLPAFMAFEGGPFGFTLLFAGAEAVALVLWAFARSDPKLDHQTRDSGGFFLNFVLALGFVTAISALLDLQLLLIGWIAPQHWQLTTWPPKLTGNWAVLVGIGTSLFTALRSDAFTSFLHNTARADDLKTMAMRLATHLLMLVAGLILPLILLLAYAKLTALLFAEPVGISVETYWSVLLPLFFLSAMLAPNSFSFHGYYRDRLAQAFLFAAHNTPPHSVTPWHDITLQDLQHSNGPYPLIGAALNLQGSAEANRRGRDAEFFVMTPHYVGSDLTTYMPTRAPNDLDLAHTDPRLNLAAATAISGAAFSANMGGNTMRLFSLTLALLNMRLGYWAQNPRAFFVHSQLTLKDYFRKYILNRLFLLAEMFNALDEKSAMIYLTDGGHIENLGLYQLLKRGCKAIIVIDAEEDSDMAFPSFLKVERYARIDLGVRIQLPWEPIAEAMKKLDSGLQKGIVPKHGPHCAIGTITYQNNETAPLIYFKASLTGDEHDYILDYKKREPDFPHESTGDQFFSEEQFECYRALGFHMVDEFFSKTDSCSYDPSTTATSSALAIQEIRTLFGI